MGERFVGVWCSFPNKIVLEGAVPLCRMLSGNGRCSLRISRTKNTSRLGTKRCRSVPGWGQAGTFRWRNVPGKRNCCRLGTKRCRSVPGWGQVGTFHRGNVPGEGNTSRLGTKRCRSMPGCGQAAHPGGKTLPWRGIAIGVFLLKGTRVPAGRRRIWVYGRCRCSGRGG